MTKNDGCAFGRESRQMVTDIKEDVKDIKTGMGELSKQMTELFNHQSSKLPPWIVYFIGIMMALVSGMGVYFFTHGGST